MVNPYILKRRDPRLKISKFFLNKTGSLPWGIRHYFPQRLTRWIQYGFQFGRSRQLCHSRFIDQLYQCQSFILKQSCLCVNHSVKINQLDFFDSLSKSKTLNFLNLGNYGKLS